MESFWKVDIQLELWVSSRTYLWEYSGPRISKESFLFHALDEVMGWLWWRNSSQSVVQITQYMSLSFQVKLNSEHMVIDKTITEVASVQLGIPFKIYDEPLSSSVLIVLLHKLYSFLNILRIIASLLRYNLWVIRRFTEVLKVLVELVVILYIYIRWFYGGHP